MTAPHEPPIAAAPAGAAARDAALSTFLLTDIAGSTRLWEEHGATMGAALAIHDELLRAAITSSGGVVVKTMGDGMLAVFDDAAAALAAALVAQRALRDTSWGPTGPLRVRMAIHSGTAESREGDYFGQALNRDARILAIGHGNQILLSAVTAALTRDRLPPEVDLVDLGSHRLRDLDRPEQVFQVVAADLPRDFPLLRSLSTRRSNLPVALTSFVGRERELADVEASIGRDRLVTLIGTGGTGKTRLMLEAAGRVAERFADGAWLAELAPLAEPAQIASEVARAIGVPEEAGQSTVETVSQFLADKETLLLLDNAEHLVDGVAQVAERLLGAAPRLRILATSREALALPGESVIHVQSLACPVAAATRPGHLAADVPDLALIGSTEAVRLFTQRAKSVLPQFALSQANVGAVAEICRRLDGIPLAIELAAARVSAMSAQDIALRLGDRFRLLAGGRRTSVPRQQTLHALIDWSWDLLTEADRRLLQRLSIFAGGWTAAAAARIVGDDGIALEPVELIDGLTRLVDRSLVIVDRGPTTRYRMLETIRQYARERLIQAGEAAALADRHFAAFAALATEAAVELRRAGMVDWLDRLDADAENLGAALEWGLEAAPWEAVRMCRAMLSYWEVRVASADSESRILAAIDIARERTIGNGSVDADEQAVAAELLGLAGRIWGMSGRADLGLAWARDAVPLARASGDDIALISAISGLAIASEFGGAGGDVEGLFGEVQSIAERIGAWWSLGQIAGFAGALRAAFDVVAADELSLKGEDAARRSGNPYVIGQAAMARGRMLGVAGRTDEAVIRFEEAMARFAELGDVRMALASRSDVAHALRRGGRIDDALELYRETIGGWVYLGNRGAIANQLEQIGFAAVERGQLDRAARLLGAAEAIREAASAPMAFDEAPEYRSFVERLRAGIAADELAALWAVGRATSMAAAVSLATEA